MPVICNLKCYFNVLTIKNFQKHGHQKRFISVYFPSMSTPNKSLYRGSSTDCLGSPHYSTVTDPAGSKAVCDHMNLPLLILSLRLK